MEGCKEEQDGKADGDARGGAGDAEEQREVPWRRLQWTLQAVLGEAARIEGVVDSASAHDGTALGKKRADVRTKLAIKMWENLGFSLFTSSSEVQEDVIAECKK